MISDIALAFNTIVCHWLAEEVIRVRLGKCGDVGQYSVISSKRGAKCGDFFAITAVIEHRPAAIGPARGFRS